MKSNHKTNACRLLDQRKVPYKIHEYAVDENHLDAIHVAENTGNALEKIFKTLVLTGDKTGYIVACIPANGVLNLKKIAKVSGNKKCDMIPVKDLERVTGYIRGGCSPIGMKKQLPTFIDKSADTQATIYISAGKRGVQIEIAPHDLLAVSRAKLVAISNFA